MKKTFNITFVTITINISKTPLNRCCFWNTLEQHCGKAYEGEIIEGGKEGDGFFRREISDACFVLVRRI